MYSSSDTGTKPIGTSDWIAFFSAWEKKREWDIETNWYSVGMLNVRWLLAAD